MPIRSEFFRIEIKLYGFNLGLLYIIAYTFLIITYADKQHNHQLRP